MSTAASHTHHRVTLSFSVDGLTARDDLLLKSLVRVLDHRAHQHWQCVESGADLCVSGAPQGAPAAGPAGPSGAVVLRMGYPPGEGEFGLSMPLHAGHIEHMFNRIGDQIAQQRVQAAAVAAQQPVREGELFRLRRWPPAALLCSADRLSLAALMSARAQSLSALQRQSGVPVAQCVEFLRALRQADLVHCSLAEPAPQAAAPAVAAAEPAPTGLLARIRARFGLQPAFSR